MGFSESLRLLVAAPAINSINCKAKSIPVLNPFDKYGRVFFFSWLGFMVAFLSWFAFPPLLTDTIKKDLNMTQNDVANSNIVALLATFLVRLVAGPFCDRFGPRWVFIALLLAGAIPTAMAGLVTTPNGLIALRFFVGILGATFVPCQVWTTAFFDKPIVGTANSLTAGWGNAGAGITYFAMPAIYNSLVKSQGFTPHKAWRVAYFVPFIIITAVALGIIFLCDDTPTGKWSERHLFADSNNTTTRISIVEKKINTISPPLVVSDTEAADKEEEIKGSHNSDLAGQVDNDEEIMGYREEMVIDPTPKEALRVILSSSTLALAGTYFCTFGAELSLDAILGSYYSTNFKSLGQTQSGQWAAMFGLLNIVFRPLGGYISDLLYHKTHSVWVKKFWLTFLVLINGVFLLAIGLNNPRSESTMFGLVAGLAFFLEAANGANFSAVPHVHPFANGIVSGLVGAAGNFGGVIFNIVFRYNGTDYSRSIWIMGVISLAIGIAQAWIRPIPKGQIGGH